MSPAPPRRVPPQWHPVAAAAAVAVGAVGALAAPRIGIPAAVGALVAGATGVLGVLGLPSFSTRRATILLLGAAGVAVLRHAVLPDTDGLLLAVWAAATLVAIVAADRADAERLEPLPGGAPLAPRGRATLRTSVAIGALVAVTAVAVVPPATEQLHGRIEAGAVPTLGDRADAPGSVRASESLDMTNRPRLSDQVVFTVDAERPDFWRGEVFDVWNGSEWRRSDDQLYPLRRDGDRTALLVDAYDTGAVSGAAHEQTFRIESDFVEVVFASPAGVTVATDKQLLGRADGSAGALGGFGRGAVYRVTSRSVLPTEAALRAADAAEMPREIVARYGQAPVTTERVRRLAADITATAPTTYDKVRAMERWLGANTRYSLDAPLSPRGVDVVDHFLFASRLGWCEQVASSLVVLARSAGIPARLATGFVTGERNAISGRFTVRERDAHAWAEVYFPGIGWQGFDPTASVPLAGDAPDAGSILERARDRAPQLLAVLGLAVALVAFGPELLARWRAARRRNRVWAVRAFSAMERAGRMAARPRADAETPREYAAALAGHFEEPQLLDVARAIERDAYGAQPVDTQTRAAVDAVLERIRRRRGRGGTVRRTVKGIP